MHEGYLLDQFSIAFFNKRTDEYGGSFENRYRFAAEVVKAIKESCGDDFPVSLRYSVESKLKGFAKGIVPGDDAPELGRNMEESERAAKYLQDAGYDMLNADNGTYDSWYWAHPPMYMPQNCNLEDVAHIKKFVDIPVVCAGRMEPDVAAEAIAEGKIDGMGVARQFLADPEWIIIATGAKANRIPVPGVEKAIQAVDFLLGKQEVGDNVTIIGGGLTGCEIAYELYLQGKHPTIVEMQDDLITTPGICLANTSFLRDFFKANKVPVYLETGVKAIEDDGVTVKDKDGVELKIAADNVILSVGYKPAPLTEKAKNVHIIGDAEKVGNLRTVIWGAWDVCMKL